MSTQNQTSTGSAEAEPMPVSGNPYRDIVIVLGVVAVFTVGFFVVRSPGIPPQPPTEVGGGGHDAMQAEMLSNLPRSFDGLVAEGNKQMDQGNYVVAAEVYRRALEIKPDVPDVRVDFGTCLFAMGLPERAREEFTEVLAEIPDHGIATFNMGIVLSHLGRTDSARMYWQRYLEMYPDGQTADRARDLLTQTVGE